MDNIDRIHSLVSKADELVQASMFEEAQALMEQAHKIAEDLRKSKHVELVHT